MNELKVSTQTGDWKNIVDYCHGQIDTYHNTLERRDLSHEHAQFIKGKIAALRELMKAPNPTIIK
jgi:hypothetical protein